MGLPVTRLFLLLFAHAVASTCAAGDPWVTPVGVSENSYDGCCEREFLSFRKLKGEFETFSHI